MICKYLLIAALCCVPWQYAQSLCLDKCEKPSIGVVDNMLKSLTTALNEVKCSLSDPKIWPQNYAKKVLKDNAVLQDFDFIVVGSGTAGSVVASRLSENANYKVLVLESGGDPPLESELFSLSMDLVRTEYTWNDYMEPNPNCCQAMIRNSCFVTRGKMIGGSGAVNGNIFLQGTRKNFEDWAQAGNVGWSWEDAKFYYKKATTKQGNSSFPMGGLTLNYFAPLPQNEDVTNLMYDAAAELGIPRVPTFDEEHPVGYTTNIPTTTANGLRMSTGKVYLSKVARKRPNIKVIKNAHVEKVIIDENKRAVGVYFTLQGNKNFSVRATKEVILSAGALSSPQLLLLSGVGPREQLESLGVPVHQDLQVGENLQDHPLLPLFFKIGGNLNTSADNNRNIMDYFMNMKGSYASGLTLYGFVNTDLNSTVQYPDWQTFAPFIMPGNDPGVGAGFNIKPEIWGLVQKSAGNRQLLVFHSVSMKPHTRGRVQLRSTDPFDTAKIINVYGEHPADKAATLRFVRYMQRLEKTSAFRAHKLKLIHVPLPECEKEPSNSDKYWLCYAKYFQISSWHPAGTCKMGPDQDAAAVVDERLRVRGVEGLRVIDASIMPVITSGNTNGPTVMIAEKGADMIKEDWQNI